MNGYIGQNTKNVEEFIEHIRERIIAAANNWKEIAAAFAEAKEMYGFDSDTFKQLCIATKFSKSKACKLATIARSERLKKYEKELSAVQSWTVLYAITTLNDEQFERLLKNKSNKVTDFGEAEIITVGMIAAARQVITERSSMRVYAKISVDVDAVRARLMDGDSIEALEEALREIQVKVPYIKVEKWDVFENGQHEYFASLSRAFEIERRKAFTEAVKMKLEKNKKASWESKEQHEKRVLGQSKASVMDQFTTDAEEMFQMITGDYDESVFWNRAQERLDSGFSKIIKKVSDRGGAFVHANAAIKEIKEIEESKAEDEEALREWKTRSTFRYRAFDKSKFADFK